MENTLSNEPLTEKVLFGFGELPITAQVFVVLGLVCAVCLVADKMDGKSFKD